jgi:hypothetical protein
MLADGKVVLGPLDGKLMADQVMAFVAKAGKVAPKPEGRVEVVP